MSYVLRKTWNQWSPGTMVDFIEYAEYKNDEPISALVRIRGEQSVIPLHFLVERRERTSIVQFPTRHDKKRMMENDET